MSTCTILIRKFGVTCVGRSRILAVCWKYLRIVGRISSWSSQSKKPTKVTPFVYGIYIPSGRSAPWGNSHGCFGDDCDPNTWTHTRQYKSTLICILTFMIHMLLLDDHVASRKGMFSEDTFLGPSEMMLTPIVSSRRLSWDLIHLQQSGHSFRSRWHKSHLLILRRSGWQEPNTHFLALDALSSSTDMFVRQNDVLANFRWWFTISQRHLWILLQRSTPLLESRFPTQDCPETSLLSLLAGGENKQKTTRKSLKLLRKPSYFLQWRKTSITWLRFSYYLLSLRWYYKPQRIYRLIAKQTQIWGKGNCSTPFSFGYFSGKGCFHLSFCHQRCNGNASWK